MQDNNDNLCRLCLQIKVNLFNIFENCEDETVGINEIISEHLRVQISDEDEISKFICSDCWTSLKEFHLFYSEIVVVQNSIENFEVIKSLDIESVEIKCEYDGVEQGDVLDRSNTTEDILECEEIDSYLNTSADEDEDEQIDDDDDDYDDDDDDYDDDDDDYDDDDDDNENYSIPAKKKRILNVTETSTSRSVENLKKNEQKSFETLQHEDEEIKEYFKIECELCDIMFEKFHLLKTHFREIHKKAGYVSCCDKRFFSRSEALHHLKRHSDPNFFKCEVCGKVFVDLKGLRGHMFLHAPEEERKYKCSSCPKTFVKQYMLKSHEIIHVPVDDRQFNCDLCDRSYASKQLLHGHIKSAHQKQTYICEICAKSFRDKIWFQTHVREHQVVGPKVQCEICSQWYKDKNSLKKHLVKHEEAKLKIFCDICGKQSPSYSALRAHKRNSHGGEKDRKYKCSICVKAFKKSIALKEHMAVHTGEDLYTCMYCLKKFKSNANMYAHRKKCSMKDKTELPTVIETQT